GSSTVRRTFACRRARMRTNLCRRCLRCSGNRVAPKHFLSVTLFKSAPADVAYPDVARIPADSCIAHETPGSILPSNTLNPPGIGAVRPFPPGRKVCFSLAASGDRIYTAVFTWCSVRTSQLRDDFDPLASQREAAMFYGLFLRGHSVE